MKALVTGGTGFVGSHVARTLDAAGHGVRVLHRTTSRLDALAGVTFESSIGDITDRQALRAACQGVDWVFHVAAVADYWRSDPQRIYHINVDGTRCVLEAAREAGVQRVVFTSSAAAVGMPEDGVANPADESVPFNLPPERFPYGHSKVQAEEVVRQAVMAGQDVVTVNPVIVIGPGDLNLISGTFVTQMQRLQWLTPMPPGGVALIDVRDVAAAQLAAAERGRTGERYLLNTANLTFREFFHLIAAEIEVARPMIRLPGWLLPPVAAGVEGLRRLGITLPVDANQIRLGGKFIYYDASKAHTELGQPQISIQQSVRDTYQWYREHGYIREDALTRAIGWLGRVLPSG